MSDKESQDDELLALASIYEDDVFSSTQDAGESPGGQFAAHLDLPQPFQVQFETSGGKKSYEVEYLPPVMLYFNFPADYPSKSPPTFTLSSKWLSLAQLSSLCKQLDELWEENSGDVILFHWTNFLKNESCEALNITSPLDLSHVVVSKAFTKQHSKAETKPVKSLVSNTKFDFNNKSGIRTRYEVTSKSNNSGVCDTTGSSDLYGAIGGGTISSTSSASASYGVDNETCHGDLSSGGVQSQISLEGAALCDSAKETCDPRAIQDIASQKLLLPLVLEHDTSYREHVFKTTLYTCQVCFQERLGDLCIQFTGCSHVYCKECMAGYFEIQIKDGNVQCLTCPNDKCDSQAHPSQVSELVNQELFSRYDRLLLQSSLDTMTDIVYCPRKGCQCPVMVDSDNMGSCAACHYVFCVFCKMAYHGVSPCRLKPDAMRKLRTEYEEAPPHHKVFMEQRYGKEVIRRAIQETYTDEWLQEYSKKCPHCGTNIEKIDGCNKMTCTKCQCHFCWICNSLLPRSNPYSHFNLLGAKCFNMLFHGVAADDGYDDDDDYY